jgi:hypothetical protein
VLIIKNFLEEKTMTNENDAWVDELIAWADKNEIDEDILPRNKEALLNLTELDLSGNGLSTLPESIGNLTNLTDLDLSYNDLNTLPKSIGNLTNLNVLDLRENNVHSKYALPESVGQLISRLNLTCFDDEDMDADYFKSEFHSY